MELFSCTGSLRPRLRAMFRRVVRNCLPAALLVAAGSAHAGWLDDFDEMVVFGESSSDTGNVEHKQCPPLPQWGPWAPCSDIYFDGNLTNGRIWVEFLADWLGLPRPEPSELGGSNYAHAGAKTGAGDNLRISLLSGEPVEREEDQIQLTAVPGVLKQVATYLAEQGAFNPRQLVVIWGGANDLRDIAGPEDIAAIADNLVTATTTAACAGAEHILIPNQLNASLAPAVRMNPDTDPADVELAIRGLNVALLGKLTALASSLPSICGADAKLYYVNVFATGQALVALSQRFGIPYTNITDPAVDLRASGAAGTFVLRDEIRRPSDVNDYLFLDTIHVTMPAQRLLAAKAWHTLVFKRHLRP